MIRPDSPLRPWVAIAALAFSLGLAAPANAQAGDPAAAERKAELRARAAQGREKLQQEAEQREEWQTNYRNLLLELRTARESTSAATIEKRKLRKHHRLRGEPRLEANKKIEESEKQSELAYEELVRFYARARAASIEPAWLHEVEDEFPALVDTLPENG